MPPNSFGIAFGLAGLASMWRAMEVLVADVGPVVAVLTVLATVVEVFLLVAYVIRVASPGALRRDLNDPVMGPFISLAFIVGMIDAMLWYHMGVQGARVVVLVFAIAALLFGGWITGYWITTPLAEQTLNPAYFLPTVAGGLIGATTLQAVGFPNFAIMALGIGLICWVLVGSIVQYRLWVGPPLPTLLVPLLAIELAPPAVAGNAWVAMEPRMNPVQWALIGYTLLMIMVQVRLIPIYRKLPFMPSFWAFSFSYAATATYAMHWLALDPFPGGKLTAWLIAIVITVFIGWISVRTVQGVRAGTYFPMANAEDVSESGSADR